MDFLLFQSLSKSLQVLALCSNGAGNEHHNLCAVVFVLTVLESELEGVKTR